MHRLGVLISGRGSNLQAIIDAVSDGRLHAEIALVLSDVPDAAGLRRATDAGIATRVVLRRDHPTRDAFERQMLQALEECAVHLICLAGFMRVLGPTFVGAFRDRLLNIHPSLLPSFPGLHAQRQAFDHGVKIAGATVHFVTEQLDAGPIVMQSAVPVLEADTVESLSARILVAEHQLYPAAIQQVLNRLGAISPAVATSAPPRRAGN